MSIEQAVTTSGPKGDLAEAYQWLAQVLTSFARAEQAIGQLCFDANLPMKAGLLGSLNELRCRLERSEDRRCRNLEKRIARWQSLRPVRHLLAHGTISVVYDEARNPLFVTRHLPLEREDVTPDRVWTHEERVELLRVATNDGRSIQDQVRNLLLDAKLIEELRKP